MSTLARETLEKPSWGQSTPTHMTYQYINTLINCSGITSNQLVLKQRQEDAEAVWDTNYHMPFKLSQHLLSRYMAQSRSLQKTNRLGDLAGQPSWCIVNVSSLLAEKGGRGSATYAATK